MVEHVDISSSQCHEPKHISVASTADTGKVITASSSVNGTSEFRKLTFNDLDINNIESPYTYGGRYSDSYSRSGSATTNLRSGVLGNDAAYSGTHTDRIPSGVTIWNTSTALVKPEDEKDIYLVTISGNFFRPATTYPNPDIDEKIGVLSVIRGHSTNSVLARKTIYANWAALGQDAPNFYFSENFYIYADSAMVVSGFGMHSTFGIRELDFNIIRLHQGG